MKLYAVFSRGARGNCLIRLTQYPPLTPSKTQKFRGTLFTFNPGTEFGKPCSIV